MSWCDVVTLPDGSFGRVTVSDKTVSLLNHWTVTASEPLGFCRAATTQRGVLTIHGGQSDTAWLIGERVQKNLGPCFGVQPVAISPEFVYIVRTNQVYSKIDLTTFNEQVFQHGVPGSSQGISDIAEDGTIWWADAKRIISVDNRKLIYPNVRGQLAVGQFENPDQIVGVFKGTNPPTHFTAFETMTYEPHVSKSGDRYIICARSGRGPLFIEVPPFPQLVSESPPPVITPPVIPPPVPPPSPMLQPKLLPADVHAIAVALYERNTDLAHGSDDQRRVLQQKVCETVRARKGPSWGWKSNHGIGIANSTDAIAELPEGAEFRKNERQPLYMWDLFNGSTRKPNPLPVMSEGEHVEQFFVPVEPIDHLDDDVDGDPEEKPKDPEKPFDPVPLLSAIANLTAQIEGLRIRIKHLEEKPSGVVSGHPVEVSGSVSWRDAIRGATVIWQGKIK